MRMFGSGEEQILSVKIRRDIGLIDAIPQKLQLPDEELFRESISRLRITSKSDRKEVPSTAPMVQIK
jgi:hypothetical protein